MHNLGRLVDQLREQREEYARKLGQQLTRVSQLPSVDTELLVWAAAARWLARNRMEGLGALTLQEYRALSLRLSSGAHVDVLGLLPDLQD